MVVPAEMVVAMVVEAAAATDAAVAVEKASAIGKGATVALSVAPVKNAMAPLTATKLELEEVII